MVQIEITIDEFLGRKVREGRKAKGLTQKQFADRLGCSAAHVSDIEVGDAEVKSVMFLKIVDVLGKAYGFFLPKQPVSPEKVTSKVEKKVGGAGDGWREDMVSQPLYVPQKDTPETGA